MSGYQLPEVGTGEELQHAIQCTLDLLQLADPAITYPLLASVFRSVIGDCDFSLYLAGPSGVFKSELAALAQQFFGSGLSSRNLPGSWSSTVNSLEELAFKAKDALLTIDDFAPAGGIKDIAQMHRNADRLFRAQGNHSGRGRTKADGTLRPEHPPRGLVLATGEDIPRGQSLRARLMILELSAGDIDSGMLTECQQNAMDGEFAMTLAAYLSWLAGRFERVKKQWVQETAVHRGEAAKVGLHARTPGIVAELFMAFEKFLQFAEESLVLTSAQRKEVQRNCWTALVRAAEKQTVHQTTNEPAAHFIRLLQAVLSGGRGHLVSVTDDVPENSDAWGWYQQSELFQPQGRKLGWIGGEDLYLDLDSAFAEVQKLAQDQGESIAVTQQTLKKRLSEKGFLKSTDRNRNRLTIRKTLSGSRREVLHLTASTFTGESSPSGTGSTELPERDELVESKSTDFMRGFEDSF